MQSTEHHSAGAESTSRIGQLLEAAVDGVLPEQLRDVSAVAEEREIIDEYLSLGGHRVYGFTTFLGQRDDTDATPDYQDRLLEGHLVGRVSTVDPATMRLITVAKLFQAQAGGSGISAQAYQLVLDRWSQDVPTAGAWRDYYGAGDVIPGSWWINCQLGGAEPSEALRSGDLIAMMSGTFVSTGFAAEALAKLVNFASDALWVLSRHCHAPHPGLSSAGRLDTVFCDHAAHGRHPVAEQASVVTRDGGPFTATAANAVTTLAQALDQRLGRPSANPWFDVDTSTGTCAGHYSQSSFLDLAASSALGVAADAVRFLAAGIKAVIAPEPGAVSGVIERPKIAEVIIEELSAQPSARFAINEADGAEDIADRTLARAHRLSEMTETGMELIDLYLDAQPGDQRSRIAEERAEVSAAMHTALREMI